eukprot:m.31484 g.31484  ORF g.31484 m.31484 type:complete len:702 (+) comp9760_c0_seq1:455-2560(+)
MGRYLRRTVVLWVGGGLLTLLLLSAWRVHPRGGVNEDGNEAWAGGFMSQPPPPPQPLPASIPSPEPPAQPRPQPPAEALADEDAKELARLGFEFQEDMVHGQGNNEHGDARTAHNGHDNDNTNGHNGHAGHAGQGLPRHPVSQLHHRDHRDLVVGVLTDPKSLTSICMAAYTTWVRDLEALAKVYFFIGSCQAVTKGFPGNLVCLDTPDTYPPQRKVFLMWKWLHDNELRNYQWFMKVDHDSYVNVRRIGQLVKALGAGKQRFRRSYIGSPVSGRREEQSKLGLNGARYCLGMGYIVNFLTLREIGKHLMTCAGAVVSNHSDTEMGRCIHRYAGIQCLNAKNYDFKQVYYQQDGGRVFPMKLQAGGQMALTFPREPKHAHFAAVLVHPLKRAEDFYRFHKQSISKLRPLQPLIAKNNPQAPYQSAIEDLKSTCVHNPVCQAETMGYELPECETPQPTGPVRFPVKAFIFTSDQPPSDWYVKTKRVLEFSNIEAVQVRVPAGWTSESSDPAQLLLYLQVMRSLFRNATLHSFSQLMIIDEKVVFSCKFSEKFWGVLNSRRCGGHLHTDLQGGLLLLGTEVPSHAGMEAISDDRSRAFANNQYKDSAALCYNAHQDTRGMLAAVFHRNTFGQVLSWLSERVTAREGVSFDHVYKRLSLAGYIVRAAFPNLVARHPSEPSRYDDPDPNSRARWYSQKYCQPKGV